VSPLPFALSFAFAAFGAALGLNLWRLWRGPTLGDRVLALDTMVVNAIAVVLLYGIAAGTTVYFEAALLFALTGFVSTVAYARFALRGSLIE
jgi:multicomponent K+:H+ antiporter subunit F